MSTLFLQFYLMYKKPFDPKRKPFIFRRSVRNSRRIDCTGDRMKMLFPLLIFLSVFFGLLTGNMNAVAEAAMTSAGDAIDLVISLTGTICLWGGIMETAKAAGITASALQSGCFAERDTVYLKRTTLLWAQRLILLRDVRISQPL